MAGSDVDAFTGRVLAAEGRHPVERLDGEGVGGVRQQAPHLHPATQQALLGRPVADTVSAGEALSTGRPAHGAPDRVAHVGSAPVVQGLVPLQAEGGVVDLGADATRGWRSFYSDEERNCLNLDPAFTVLLTRGINTTAVITEKGTVWGHEFAFHICRTQK